MDYCIADIHGHYDLFCRLMDKIGFSDGDRLYVMGDIVDKGPDSVKLAKLLFSMPGVYAIVGNHEHVFLNYYHELMKQTEDYDFVLEKLRSYFSDGKLLDWDIIDQLDELPYYIETDSFIGVHAGVSLSGGAPDPANTPVNNLVYDRRFKDPDVLPDSGKCVFYGHTPTWYVTGGKNEILLYPRQGASISSGDISDYCKVHLDTDTYLTGVLGCISADTMECFYVDKKKRGDIYG